MMLASSDRSRAEKAYCHCSSHATLGSSLLGASGTVAKESMWKTGWWDFFWPRRSG